VIALAEKLKDQYFRDKSTLIGFSNARVRELFALSTPFGSWVC